MPYKTANRTNVFQCHFQLCPLRAFKNVGLISQVHSSRYVNIQKKLLLFSLSNLCIKADPLGSVIKDSGTSLGLGRERARATVALLLYEPTVTDTKTSWEATEPPKFFSLYFPPLICSPSCRTRRGRSDTLMSWLCCKPSMKQAGEEMLNARPGNCFCSETLI